MQETRVPHWMALRRFTRPVTALVELFRGYSRNLIMRNASNGGVS